MKLELPNLNPNYNPTISKNDCKGLFYRCRISDFLTTKGEYISQFRMVPLKRKSCKGCTFCGLVLDDLKEFLSMGMPPIVDNPVDGALYMLIICNESRDWETGMIDDWDVCFKKIDDE